jgi:hypothetical protein
MFGGDLESRTVGLGNVHFDFSTRLSFEEVSEANSLDDVAGTNATVVLLVGEPEREDALLLEVRLMDTSE